MPNKEKKLKELLGMDNIYRDYNTGKFYKLTEYTPTKNERDTFPCSWEWELFKDIESLKKTGMRL